MSEIKWVNPFRCRVWEHNGRLEEYLSVESCRDEIASFVAHGQLLPVIGRRLIGNAGYDFEIICGARRLFVAQHLNVSLMVETRELSDREAAVAVDIENCRRKDLSAYERGRSIARWLSKGFFASQDEIARALGISASQVSKFIKVGRLPSVIINAFSKPSDIHEVWGLDLYSVWEDEGSRALLAARARRIAKQKLQATPREVYEQLMAAAQAKEKRVERTRDEVVRGADGRPLFRIRHQHQAVALVISKHDVAPRSLDKIKELLVGVLQDENLQAVDNVRTLLNLEPVDAEPVKLDAKPGGRVLRNAASGS